MIPKVNEGLDKWDLCFVIYMFLSNNSSSGDINSSNLSCFILHADKQTDQGPHCLLKRCQNTAADGQADLILVQSPMALLHNFTYPFR